MKREKFVVRAPACRELYARACVRGVRTYAFQGALVVALVVLTVAPLAAQVYDRPLTEQDLQRLTPVLRAEKTGAARIAKQATEAAALEQKRAAGRQQAVSAIAGGEDPSAWLTRLSSNAVAPSTSRYDAACSRALTQSQSNPSAVFSFGIAAPPAWVAVWKARDSSVPIGDRTHAAAQPGAQRPGATRPETVVQQARAFYSARRWEYQGEPAPFEWQFVAPDRLVAATLMGVNVLGQVEACRALADGPTITVKAADEAFGKGPARPRSKVNYELADALEKSGLRREEYVNLREQLRVAQADAKDPSRLAVPPGATEEQRKDLAIRAQNAQFYRQHAAAIAPLLEGIVGVDSSQ